MKNTGVIFILGPRDVVLLRYRTISIRISGGGTGLAGVFRISFLGFSTELKAEYGKSSDVS